MNDLMTKSFQSYIELKKQAIQDLETEQVEQDIEMGQLDPSDEQNLSRFFEQVDTIKKDMEEITNLLLDLHDLNEQTKSTTSAKVLRGIRDRMNSDMVSILRKGKIVKSRLEPLDKCNRSGSTTIVDRTRVDVTYGLRVKLRDTMNDLRSLREKIMNDQKSGVKRMYYNATGEEASEETIEKMISGSGQKKIFEAKADFEDEERNLVLKNMQRSLTELHQLFLDMAVMVDTQGDKIDDIEENVARAGVCISGGTNGLFYANQMKKKKTTWVCLVGVLLLVVLLVCLSSILVS